MYTTDEIGNPIYVLPECAYCVLKGAFLDTFEDCPSCQFDRFGDRCIPALCDYYTEDYEGTYLVEASSEEEYADGGQKCPPESIEKSNLCNR